MNGKTNVTVGTSTDLQIPLDPCTSLGLTAGNAQVEITWTDPVDKYATPEGETAQDPQQLVSIWDHTIIVRKVGSPPVGPNDGMVVASSEVRNQYQTTPYIDTGLTNNTTYFCAVYAINQDDVPSEGVYDSAMPRAGTPLSELAEGTIIKIKENGSPVEYILAKHNYEPDLNGTGRELCVRRRAYGGSRQYHPSEGNIDMSNCNLMAYLNNTYKNIFETSTQTNMNKTTFYYPTYNDQRQTLSCSVFFLSFEEYGGDKYLDFSIGSKLLTSDQLIYTLSVDDNYWVRDMYRGMPYILVVDDYYYDDWQVTLAQYSVIGDMPLVIPVFTLPNTNIVDENMNLI